MTTELLAALREMVDAHPVCTHPIGAPGSRARQHQERQEAAVKRAKALLRQHNA